MATALRSESSLTTKDSHCCTDNYSSLFSDRASSLKTNNNPNKPAWTPLEDVQGRQHCQQGENYSCDAPLADSDFGSRPGAFINLSAIAKSSLKTESTKPLFVECISKHFLHSLFTDQAFPHQP